MAKKKLNHQADEATNPEFDRHQDLSNRRNSNPTMDDAAEKIQSLKQLNSLLLKETSDRRHQVESLVKAKEALEAELRRYGEEKEELKARLSNSREQIFGLELENFVVCVFAGAQMGHLAAGVRCLANEKHEIEGVMCQKKAEVEFLKKEVNGLLGSVAAEREQASRLSQEIDVVRNEFSTLFQSSNGLKMKVVDMEERERKIVKEAENLKIMSEELAAEKAEREKEIKEVARERDLVERNLDLSAKVIDDLKSQIHGIMREKSEVERENNGKEMTIDQLEREIKQLNGLLSSSRMENEALGATVSELEKSVGEALEKEKCSIMEINKLVAEQKENEKKIRMLVEERDSIQKALNLAREESVGVMKRIEIIVQERHVVEEAKVKREGEINELQKEVSELKTAISKLKESCRVEEEKNKKLALDLIDARNAVDRAKREREDTQKSLVAEKKNADDLTLKVSELEKKLEKAVAELGKMKTSQEDLQKRKKDAESRIEVLVKDKGSAEESLMEAQRVIDDLRVKVKSTATNSERALALLKNTAAVICLAKDGGDMAVNEHKCEEEVQPYATELDAIKNAFRNKEKIVEEMKQELELVRAKAAKGKNFWAVLTTATTILAAISAAYAAKAH